MHCALTQPKMAASNEDDHAAQQISSACAIAKQALKAIGNLQSNDIRNAAALTATNSSSTSSSPSSSSGSIAAELAPGFPSYNARGVTSRRKRPSSSNSSSFLPRGKKNGRPSKTIVHKDLVIIPNPNTNQVPSNISKVKLEERGLIIHQLPFNKDWTHLDLKRNIESQLPRDDIMFEYLKVSFHFCFVLSFLSLRYIIKLHICKHDFL